MRVQAGAHPSTMDVTVRNSTYCGLLTVSGELDIETAPQLTKVLDWMCQQPQHQVTVDLRQVTFIDSSGLGALIRAQHALAAASMTRAAPSGLYWPIPSAARRSGFTPSWRACTVW